MKKEILQFISLCRKTFGEYPEHSGGCYKFSLILMTVFGGHMYWTADHIITWIDGVYYDINGEVKEGYGKYFLVGGEHVTQEFVDKAYKEYL